MADAEEITMDGAKCHQVVHFHQNWKVFFSLKEEHYGHHVFTLLLVGFGKTTF